MNDYGAKASRDLIVTRGAGFRKEKNKKKRGSYVGGEITVSFERDTAIESVAVALISLALSIRNRCKRTASSLIRVETGVL